MSQSFAVSLRLVGVVFFVLGAMLVSIDSVYGQQASPERVYVVEIHGDIDLGLAPYVERVIADAADEGALAVVVRINSSGGELDAALRIRRALLDASIPTIAFIEGGALSHAALVAISAQQIYMAPSAVLGSGISGTKNASSAIRSRYRSTAEQRGRDPNIAEAMVAPTVQVPGLPVTNVALTLTPAEATANGYAEGIASNVEEVLGMAGFERVQLVETSPTIAEEIVRILTIPWVAVVLFAAGIILIVSDLLSGGISPLTAGGIVLITVFFWGHFLAGLAGWEGVALVVLGLIFVAIETFVVPGFGVAGILGIVSLLAGFYLSLIGGEITTSDERWRAAEMVALVIIVGAAGIALMLWILPGSIRSRGMVLQAHLEREVVPPPAVTPSGVVGQHSAASNSADLTARESEVLRLIASGRTNQEIADDLSISVRTVERHITNLYHKVEVTNRAEATAYAFRQNLT